ncbi:hypothetical protein D3C77_53870 [compost metagenome]
MSEADKPAGEGQTSRQNSVTPVEHQSVQCYFRPDTEEFVFIDAKQAGAFEQHWQDMLVGMDDYHRANADYLTALEGYEQAGARPGLSGLDEPQQKAVSAAEAELAKKREALQQKLGDFSQEGMSYDDVVELLPVADTRRTVKEKGKDGKVKSRQVGRRYAYVKKAYYDNSKKNQGLRNVSLKAKDKQGASESIYGRDKHGNVRIDGDKLAKQLTQLQSPKLKLELKDLAKWAGMEDALESLSTEGTLFDWADTWNENLNTQRELGANVDVSAGAQFMRYVSNVGASAEFDPKNGNVSIKGEGKASLTVAAGTAQMQIYVPDRLGWALAYTTQSGQVFDLGMLRLNLTPALSGFIGASVMVEGQLQVVVQGDQQMLAGQPGGRLPRFTERKTTGAKFHQKMSSEDEGLTLSGEAFAGARVEGSLRGALQWLKPAAPVDLDGKSVGLLKSSGEFTDFCSIGPSIAAMAGAGIGGKFYCTFINGKFCFHVAASLCWGVGAKGSLICEVGVDTIVEFGAWLVYQLYRLNYRFFDVIKKDAFKAYSQYCVIQMASLEDGYYQVYGSLGGGVNSVAGRFKKLVETVSDEAKVELEGSRRRNELAENINSNSQELLRYTPEAKGVLLYLLTRHGTWDILDSGNRGNGLIPDLYKQRKDAVIFVLNSIQTRAEWRKVFCRMTSDGSSMSQGDDEWVIVEQQERYLVSFLQLGFNRDQDLYKAKGELVAIRERLKTEVSWGYALAMNNTYFYQLSSGQNPYYPQCRDLGSCEEFDRLA